MFQRARVDQKAWNVPQGNTIAVVPQPSSLTPLCIQEGDTTPNLHGSVSCFKVRLAGADGCQSASVLVRRRYAWRGYRIGPEGERRPDRITLFACDEQRTIATISVGLDSDAGLFVDNLYRAEIDRLRNEERKVCEFTKLAVEHSIRSKPVLAAIFHAAYIYARRINHCSDLVVEVNPRHVDFYKRMLDFTEFGQERFDFRVKAPAVLLRLDLASAQQQIGKLGGQVHLENAKRSLYPYFYSRREEAGIEWRLRTLR